MSGIYPSSVPPRGAGAYWLWSNRVWPEDRSIVTVAEHADQLVGHYAFLPFRLHIKAQLVRGGLGVNAFVASEARDKVYVFQISKQARAHAKDMGLQVLWAFPNANHRLIMEKVEGWHCVDVFKAFEKSPQDDGASCLALDSLDPLQPEQALQLDDFLEGCAGSSLIHVSQTYAAWINRYSRHPHNEYKFHFLRDGREPVAALVTKVYQDPGSGQTRGHVVDLATRDDAWTSEIIAALECYFRARVDKLSFWPMNAHFRASLTSAGFAQEGFDTFMGIKVLDPNLECLIPDLTSAEKWHLPMGMSDVF